MNSCELLVLKDSFESSSRHSKNTMKTSSHSDNGRDEVVLAAHTLEGSALSDLYKNACLPSFMRYVPKDGEQVVFEEIFIPDVD